MVRRKSRAGIVTLQLQRNLNAPPHHVLFHYYAKIFAVRQFQAHAKRCAMDTLWALLPPHLWLAALAIAVLAGIVKGVVGFAMPLIIMSGLSSFTTPDLALAGLILSTVITNGLQAARAGLSDARDALWQIRLYLLTASLMLFVGAMSVPYFTPRVYFLMLGIPILAFVVTQLLGWGTGHFRQSAKADISIGLFAGFFGGIAGIWGPPTVAYLTALNTPKRMQMQLQGIIYGVGAVFLLGAHTVSGILRGDTLLFSAILVVPACLGMWLGTTVQDRIDQTAFRRATLVVLLIAGVNLVRRGLVA